MDGWARIWVRAMLEMSAAIAGLVMLVPAEAMFCTATVMVLTAWVNIDLKRLRAERVSVT